MPISILVHGGAGDSAHDDSPEHAKRGCLAAARAGHEVLLRGGSAVDAVVAAAVVLEDDPTFNAGTGSALNADGEVETDASLMEGDKLAAGAVASVKGIKNPIRLARLVMERTPHVLLACDGALRFARQNNVPFVDPKSMVTPRILERWRSGRRNLGTIGAVAIDARGTVAAATSTGGIMGKLPGRVGDSPLIGSGTYADNLAGAASATGMGEAIIKVVLTKFAVDRLRAGLEPMTAALQSVKELERVGGHGGVILVDREGRLGFGFNTERMARAWIDGKGTEGTGFGR
jgi:beta-aspartyl-peptidase (threonine type)